MDVASERRSHHACVSSYSHVPIHFNGGSRGLDKFLKYAPRSPAGLVYGDMWAKMPESYAADTPNQPVLLDVDSAVVVDKYMPLTLLKEICTQDSFPLHLRRDLAMAV